jgi:CRISPR/Cas system CSM-associated protein Csm2 small subunit
MRLTLTEKKIVKRLVEHAIELEQQDRIAYHKGKKRKEREELKKLLASILKKVSKDIDSEEEKKDE